MCIGWSLHHLWYFFAGAAFWDVVERIGFQLYGILPINIWGITVTTQTNYIMIALSAVLCLGFIYLGQCSSCKPSDKNSSSKPCC
jgi:hypothetical protein